jgi:hypothetical protein
MRFVITSSGGGKDEDAVCVRAAGGQRNSTDR